MKTPDSNSSKSSVVDSVYRRVTWRLSSLLFLGYLLNYLDRTNVGFAKLQMENDLRFSAAAYGLGAGLFFVSYVLFSVPSNLLLSKVGARRTICVCLLTWGLISSATMLVRTPIEFYIARFLLGVAEAGFYPGAIFYITTWYPSGRRANVFGIFTSAAVVAGVVAGVVSGSLMTYLNGYCGLRGWQWLFLIEGLPSVALGIVVYFSLHDEPKTARWLSDAEKKIIVDALMKDQVASRGDHTLAASLMNWRVYLLGLIYFVVLFQTYALAFWQPSIIRGFGVPNLVVIGLYSAIPPLVAVFAKLWVGYDSDARKELRWHFVIPAFASAIGLFLTPLFPHSPILGIMCLALATAGVHGCVPVFWSIPGIYLTGTAAAASIALISAIGNIAGFAGPSLLGVIKSTTGGFALSLYIMGGLIALGGLLMLGVVSKEKQRAYQVLNGASGH
ncbi:MAG TPA: MFS transporter [Acidobacteriaceae bacterium]|jgi:sugar phosphate permease